MPTKTKRTIDCYRHRSPESTVTAPIEPGLCECGKVHDPDERFYVTVFDSAMRGAIPGRDRGRHGFLLGPYATHAEALANVDRGRRLAEEADSRAVWYRFGTAGVPSAYTAKIKTVFDKDDPATA